jgi:hypothetical protein
VKRAEQFHRQWPCRRAGIACRLGTTRITSIAMIDNVFSLLAMVTTRPQTLP